MKKYYTFFTLFFFSIMSFGQNSSISVEKLMEINNGSEIFEKMIQTTLPNIAPERQIEFRKKADQIVNQKKMEAKKYFEKKYNQKEFDEIYAELAQEDRVSYSEKTTAFMKEWRGFKTEFQIAFKEMYNSFQK